jgi:hypothetical protein
MFIQFALSTLLLDNIWKMNTLETLQRVPTSCIFGYACLQGTTQL